MPYEYLYSVNRQCTIFIFNVQMDIKLTDPETLHLLSHNKLLYAVTYKPTSTSRSKQRYTVNNVEVTLHWCIRDVPLDVTNVTSYVPNNCRVTWRVTLRALEIFSIWLKIIPPHFLFFFANVSFGRFCFSGSIFGRLKNSLKVISINRIA